MPAKIFLVLLLFIAHLVQAQTPPSYKYNAALKLLLADKNTASPFVRSTQQQTRISVIMELNDKAFISSLPAYDVQVHTKAGTIVTADLPLNRLEEVAALPAITRIELPQVLHHTDEKMKASTRVTPVHEALAPLDRAYKGKNVVIGVIDDGIDITHPDFYRSNGSSRIQYLWNMDYNGKPPAGFNYGFEWPHDSLPLYAERYGQKKFSVMDMHNDAPNYDPHLYRFIFKGKGFVHVWFPFGNTHPVFYFERNPLPNDPTFRLTDNVDNSNWRPA